MTEQTLSPHADYAAPAVVTSAQPDFPPRLSAPPAPTMPPPHVYAIGNIEARFPSLAVEKEFAQATRGAASAGLSDRALFHATLNAPENRYIARQLCWVLVIRGMDTYIVRPRYQADLDLLVESIRPEPSPADLDVVIGSQGPLATPDMCNGMIVPVVHFDQIYSFDRDALSGLVPRSAELSDAQNDAAVGQVLDMVLRVADNAGATDEHRALNYLTMRYSDIYTRTAEQFHADFSLTDVEVRQSTLGGDRNLVNCVFSYTSRQSGFTEKLAVTVDVTEKFPFLVDRLGPYYDRR